uniref:PXA domain-containing protein n=1 Tax=Stegastes partitus TaxID=144197 RepID=A0A3B5BD38_9TELE
MFHLAFYIFCFIGGGFVVTLLYGKTEKHLEKCKQSHLPPTQINLLKTLDEMKLEMRPIKTDRRLFALRDYIQDWYCTLSEDESFLLEIRQTLQKALVVFLYIICKFESKENNQKKKKKTQYRLPKLI